MHMVPGGTKRTKLLLCPLFRQDVRRIVVKSSEIGLFHLFEGQLHAEFLAAAVDA